MKYKPLFALLVMIAPVCHASDMGDGPAGIAVWVTGSGLAAVIAFFAAFERGESGESKGFKAGKFAAWFLGLLPLVFVAGVIAIFV